MILARANPLQGPFEGEGPENRDFFGTPEMVASLKKSRFSDHFQGPPL
jgi:hypothetical protein